MGEEKDRLGILIAEDDDSIREGLRFALIQEGYDVIACGSVLEAEKAICGGERIGLCLLDVMLPDGTGYDLFHRIRGKDSRMPVIFLTACDAEVSVVMGLDMGADDYITKPFRVRELISRIRSVLRRCGERDSSAGARERFDGAQEYSAGTQNAPAGIEGSAIRVGTVTICPSEARVYRGGEEVSLTALEYKLLLTFANHQGHVLSRNQLLAAIWDAVGDYVNDNTVNVYIKRLREKLEDDPSNPVLIETVRGLGYRMAR